MPIYSYLCKNCGAVQNMVDSAHNKRPKYKKCKECTGRCARIYTAPYVSEFKPYVTSNITGTPIAITSARQEDQVMERHGKARLLDSEPAPRPKSKEQRFKEAISKLPPLREHYEQVRHEMGIENPVEKPQRPSKTKAKKATSGT